MSTLFWATIGLVGILCVGLALADLVRTMLKAPRRNRYVNAKPVADERSSLHQFSRIMGRAKL